jgi:spore coat protein A, manganese oxidase
MGTVSISREVTVLHLRKIVAGALLAAGVLSAPMTARAAPTAPVPLPPMYDPAAPWALLNPALQPHYKYDLPVPIFYTPDTATYPGFDYYKIEIAPVEHLGVAFPQPPGGAASVPPGYQWLGVIDPVTLAPRFTPLWGYAQLSASGGLIGAVAGHPVATYPSMSFRAVKGRPVKVEWVNNTTDWHVLCPYPNDPTQPCAIDRTLMGMKPGQQPDNAQVIHLHGGEIPPDSDGFAELWFGSATTAPLFPADTFPTVPVAGSFYGAGQNIDPIFDTTLAAGNAVTLGALTRPVSNSAIYNYPMVQDAATIWYHDHALGKTRINVVAGPAGYFWIEDPAREAALGLPARGDCSNTGILAGYCYDIPVVFQDRAFNDIPASNVATFNFPNGLGSAGMVDPLRPGAPDSTGFQMHPQWVPEYFGDHAVVNGVIWPKFRVEPRPYRFRFLNGSNARCYTFGLKSPGIATSPGFTHIASEQGYLPAPAKMQKFTMCPGERMDVVIDFSALRGRSLYVTNTAGAPYPNGPTPQDPAGGFTELGNLMRFDVVKPLISTKPANADPLLTSAAFTPTWNPATYNANGGAAVTRLAPTPGAPVRELLLNEVLDDLGNPTAVQIDGKPFEAPVTETPTRGTTEIWKIANTTVDAHPIHLHLVQFQVISRQPFNVKGYADAIGLSAGAPDKTLASVDQFVFGTARPFEPNEAGWKDTVKAMPGEVTTIIATWDARWADCANGTVPLTGEPTCVPAAAAAGPFFQPVTGGPYVWHCHIVDHEDNEMMRPSLVLPTYVP